MADADWYDVPLEGILNKTYASAVFLHSYYTLFSVVFTVQRRKSVNGTMLETNLLPGMPKGANPCRDTVDRNEGGVDTTHFSIIDKVETSFSYYVTL